MYICGKRKFGEKEKDSEKKGEVINKKGEVIVY